VLLFQVSGWPVWNSNFVANCHPPRMPLSTAFQSLPNLRPVPNGSSVTVASVKRCGRSTAPMRSSGASQPFSGATFSVKCDQV
jgi:hypothetical protein